MTDNWCNPAASWDKFYCPPLLPGAEELALIRRCLRDFSASTPVLQALLLGVTGEYLTLPWPPQASLLSVDHSRSMIEKRWRGTSDQVLCADWFDMPLEVGSRNFVLCDGGLCLQAYPHAQQRLVQVLARLMPRGGMAILRCFVLPPEIESSAQVMQDLHAGKVGSISELQLRLWVVLQQQRASGTSSRQFWESVSIAVPDMKHLAQLLGACAHLLQDAANAAEARHFYFTDIAEVIFWFTANPGGFVLEEVLVPDHALGQHCPTLVLRRV